MPSSVSRVSRSALRHWPTALVCLVAAPLFLLLLERMGLRVWSVDFFAYRYAVLAALDDWNFYAAWVTGPGLGDGLPFTYPPFAILVLLPTAIEPWWLAYWLWSSATLGAVAVSLALVCPALLEKRWRLPAAVVALMPTEILAHHLMFGQINAFLMMLCLFDFWLLARGRRAGVLIGIATAVKLTPGLFIVFLLVLRRWKEAFTASVSCLVCMILGHLAFPESSTQFWTDTFWGLSTRVDLNGVRATFINKSVQGYVSTVAPGWETLGKALMALLVLGCLVLAWRLARGGEIMLAALAVGIAATLASPVSWVHHWVYLLPLIVVLIVRGGPVTKVLAVLLGLAVTELLSGAAFIPAALGLVALLVPFARGDGARLRGN